MTNKDQEWIIMNNWNKNQIKSHITKLIHIKQICNNL